MADPQNSALIPGKSVSFPDAAGMHSTDAGAGDGAEVPAPSVPPAIRKDLSEDPLFRPVSTKVSRPKFTIGGRELTPSHARMADAKKFAAAVLRRQIDKQRKKEGKL